MARARRSASGIQLEPGGTVEVVCRINPGSLDLVPGRYTLNVGWNQQLKSAVFREPTGQFDVPTFLDAFAEFEIREVATNEEQLDLMNHQARVAFEDGELPRAADVLDDVLRRQPRSVSALSTRARILAAAKQCKQSLRDWEEAARALEQDLDGGNHSIQALTPEQRRESATSMRGERRRLRCD